MAGCELLVPLQTVVGQSRPSTITFHQFFRCRVWLRPSLKSVSSRSRIDRVFDVVVNEYSPLVQPCGKFPKRNWIDCFLTRRHFRSIVHITLRYARHAGRRPAHGVSSMRREVSGPPHQRGRLDRTRPRAEVASPHAGSLGSTGAAADRTGSTRPRASGSSCRKLARVGQPLLQN